MLTFSRFSTLRLLHSCVVAPAALVASAPAETRPVRVDIPVRIDPNSQVYVRWVKVRADGDTTLINGYVRQKRMFAGNRGDLHIALLRQGQQIACLETAWKRYRFPSRGQWRFAAATDVPASTIDSIRISHVIHDRGLNSASDLADACSRPVPSPDPN